MTFTTIPIMKNKLSFIIILLLCCFPPPGFGQKITSVGTVCITVKDLNASIKFYTQVLQFKYNNTEEFWGTEYENLLGKFGIHYKIAHMQLGDEKVDLIDYLTTGGRAISETQQSNDLSFQHIAIVVSNMEKAFAVLQKNNVEFVSTNPQTLPLSNKNAAGIKAFYFHDNDNHNLELIYFPTGKGKLKWQNANGKIFMGIDHTAIGISNTESSLHFWKDFLGLEKKGESYNVGTEQAHLNNVKNAELQITGLGTIQEGVGVELLQYVQPGPNKKYPTDTQCDDLWNWITKVECDDADLFFNSLTKNGSILLSKEVATINNKKQFIARDADGHAIWFIQK